MQLVDTHNHLGCDDFNNDRSQVIKNAEKLGIIRQIVIAVFPEEWAKLIQFTQNHSSLYVACGIHPMYIPNADSIKHALNLLSDQLSQADTKFCAVGEIGLDYYIENAPKDLQRAVFQEQINIAKQYQRPILLHVRKAHADTIRLLKDSHFSYRGIVHAFSGSYEEAKEYIKLGFNIGLGGAGTYPNAKRMHRVLQQLPLESIVLETDAPDLSPVTKQGMRNSPEYLPDICKLLATIKGVEAEELASQTTHNAYQLFNW